MPSKSNKGSRAVRLASKSLLKMAREIRAKINQIAVGPEYSVQLLNSLVDVGFSSLADSIKPGSSPSEDDLEILCLGFSLAKQALEDGNSGGPLRTLVDCADNLARKGIHVSDAPAFLVAIFTVLYASQEKDAELKDRAFRSFLDGLASPNLIVAEAYTVSSTFMHSFLNDTQVIKLQQALDSAKLPVNSSAMHYLATTTRSLKLRKQFSKQIKETAFKCDHPSQLISIHSVKGGVGKSLIAIAIALALAKSNRKVCLIDLDIHGPMLFFALPTRPTTTTQFFNEWLRHKGNVGISKSISNLLIPIQSHSNSWLSNVSLIASPPNPAGIAEMDSLHRPNTAPSKGEYDVSRRCLITLYKYLVKNCGFDHIIVDSSPGLIDLSFSSLTTTIEVDGTPICVVRPRPVDLLISMNEFSSLGPALLKRIIFFLNMLSQPIQDKDDTVGEMLRDYLDRISKLPQVELFYRGQPADSTTGQQLDRMFGVRNALGDRIIDAPFDHQLSHLGELNEKIYKFEETISVILNTHLYKVVQTVLSRIGCNLTPPKRKGRKKS